MPVILTMPEEYDIWLDAPTEDALKLQIPLPDELLEIVVEGKKSDKPAGSEHLEQRS
jgi:putative SOS response-associated peptidase YedK